MQKKKRKYAHVWSRVFWHLMCIRISLVHTDACNIISRSIFTGISLQPLHYSIQRGGPFSTMTHGALMESYSVKAMTTTWTCLTQIQCHGYNSHVSLRHAWFYSGALGGIAAQLCSPLDAFFPPTTQTPHQGYLMPVTWYYCCSRCGGLRHAQPSYWFHRKI